MTDLNLLEPRFSQRQAVEISGVDRFKMDAWCRLGHIHPDMIDGRRAYTAIGLVEIAVLNLLASGFKMEPNFGRAVAAKAVYDYYGSGAAERDWALVQLGGGLQLDRWQAQMSFAKGEDGPWKLDVENAPEGERVDVILPVSSVAWQVFKKIKQALADESRKDAAPSEGSPTTPRREADAKVEA